VHVRHFVSSSLRPEGRNGRAACDLLAIVPGTCGNEPLQAVHLGHRLQQLVRRTSLGWEQASGSQATRPFRVPASASLPPVLQAVLSRQERPIKVSEPACSASRLLECFMVVFFSSMGVNRIL